MKKATLKQIADMAGVSLTTVHRALNGKGGCSRDVEERILKIAKEQGYTINLAAASLRKQPLQIALIFPFRDNGGRFSLDRILDGYIEYRRMAAEYNIVFQEFLLRSSDIKKENYLDMEYPELETVLNQIYQEMPVRYDGVVIYGMSVTRRAEALLNRIMGSGTKVVVIERSLREIEVSCTVMADDTVAGSMAAEMLCKGIREPGTVAIISKLVPDGDLCGDICVRDLADERPDLKTVVMPVVMNADESENIARELQRYPDLRGVYVTSGRHTNSTLKALERLDLKLESVIGTELYEESYQALHDKSLSALIDKRPEKIGYMSLQLLLAALYKKSPLPPVYYVSPRIVLRSNSDVYYQKIKSRYESDKDED